MKKEASKRQSLSKPEIRRFLCLSTGHLPEATYDRLRDDDEFTIDGAGAWLWVPDDPRESAEFGRETYWPEVLTVQLFARRLGCDYVLLDRDGPVTEGLPAYEWGN